MPSDERFRLDNAQLDKLSEMISLAFTDIKRLCRKGKTKQAADLAKAFQNLPKEMRHESFRLGWKFLEPYEKKYSRRSTRKYHRRVGEILIMANIPIWDPPWRGLESLPPEEAAFVKKAAESMWREIRDKQKSLARLNPESGHKRS